MTITTTLNRIREHSPCKGGWVKLLAGLGKTGPDDEVLTYEDILKINGLRDALWCCRAEPQYDKEWRLFAVWCARQVQHLMHDPRSIEVLDVAERCANGLATAQELTLAREAAWIAVRDDETGTAWVAVQDTAWTAAWIAALVAAEDDTWSAVWDATTRAQAAHFLEVVK